MGYSQALLVQYQYGYIRKVLLVCIILCSIGQVFGQGITEINQKEKKAFLLANRIEQDAHFDYKIVLSPDVDYGFGKVKSFDSPIMIVCNDDKNTIILGAEAYFENGVKWVTAISQDGGKNFSVCINYLKDKKGEPVLDSDGKPIVVPITELIYDRVNDRVLSLTASYCYASDDHGLTWYQRSYYRHSINRPEGYNRTAYNPTVGVQLENGILLAPMRFINRDAKRNMILADINFILYSKDYGETWIQSPTTPEGVICDESVVVEYKKNQVMINARGGTEYWMNKTNNGRRVLVPKKKCSNDMDKWEITGWKLYSGADGKLYDPICNASMVKLSGKRKGTLFCNPYIPGDFWPRKNLLLRYTKNFRKWQNLALLSEYSEDVKGYSALASSDVGTYFAYVDRDGQILFGDITYLVKDL